MNPDHAIKFCCPNCHHTKLLHTALSGIKLKCPYCMWIMEEISFNKKAVTFNPHNPLKKKEAGINYFVDIIKKFGVKHAYLFEVENISEAIKRARLRLDFFEAMKKLGMENLYPLDES